jgi:hypothetical protein
LRFSQGEDVDVGLLGLMPCRLVGRFQLFRGTYYINFSPEDGSGIFL